MATSKAAGSSHRKRALWLILSGAVLGTIGVALISAYLRRVTSVTTMRLWLWGVTGLASGGGLAAGAYLAWASRQVLRAGQLPIPGQHRRRALLAAVGAATLCAASLALPVLLWRLLRSLGE